LQVVAGAIYSSKLCIGIAVLIYGEGVGEAWNFEVK